MYSNPYNLSKRSSSSYLSVSPPKMTRRKADQRNKLRELVRKWRAHFKSQLLPSAFEPPQGLRNVNSVLSLGSIRDLRVHHVSDSTPVPSIRHHSVRFSHPAVRHVIPALRTPLSTAEYSIAENSVQDNSSATTKFPGQVNVSAIYERQSRGRDTVLYEGIIDRLDGVASHPRNSKLLRQREEKKANGERSITVASRSDVESNSKPWPVEGICGTHPTQPRTKSGLRALQYLSYHVPIQEEAFSDAEIFKNVDDEASREQHLQATLDQLNGPREDVNLPPRPTYRPGYYSPVKQDESVRPLYLALNRSLPMLPSLSNTDQAPSPESIFESKQSVNRHSQVSIDGEDALQTTRQRPTDHALSSQQTKMPTTIESRRPDTATSLTPDFPTTKPENSKRRTLLHSAANDLYLATPVSLASSVTPKFPVLDQEKELRRRTIIGGQQRDMALTPSTSGLPATAPAGLPRKFSIPRRGVGQAPKPQIHSGLPRLSTLPEAEEPSSSYPPLSNTPTTLAAFVAHAAKESGGQEGFISFGPSHTPRDETPVKPKPSRMALLKKIVTKTY